MARPTPVENDLNLIPIMNLVVCLIPMVLYGTALVKVGGVNANPQTFGPVTGPAPLEAPLNLAVAVGADGFRVRTDRPELAPAQDIPVRDGAPDYAGLYEALVRIKEAAPSETVVRLTADNDTQFGVLVTTMDVMRTRADDRSLLWPDVVFAVAR